MATASDGGQLKSIADVLTNVRDTGHTPESIGVVLFDYLLSQATSVGTLNAAGDTINIPMTAVIKPASHDTIAADGTHCTEVCIQVNGVIIFRYSKCVFE